MLPSSLALSNKENESFVCMAQKSIFWRKCKWERPRGSKITNFLGREVAGEGRWGRGANASLGVSREHRKGKFGRENGSRGNQGSMAVSCEMNFLWCDPRSLHRCLLHPLGANLGFLCAFQEPACRPWALGQWGGERCIGVTRSFLI